MPPRFEQLVQPGAHADIVARFSPPVRQWWAGRFAALTTPQELAVPAIQAGRHTLVCAPTGSGKTLCAFITVLSDLLDRHLAGTLNETIHCVYVSPLRALGTDIARNLSGPLNEITAFAPHAIRCAQRTGDTPAAERERMTKRPPHILITTPETLALCMANPSMRQHLTAVRTVIVDELHSLASNKRGVDLAVSIERLCTLVADAGHPEPQRIGLSATIAPLEAMAEYLVGPTRPCAIADASFDRPLELDVLCPFGNTPFATSATVGKNVLDQLEAVIRANRTTLIFTNVRSSTERITWQLRKRFKNQTESPIDPDLIQAHHGSLDRDLRLSIESRLKAGELRCVVCSTSLELGIDIGNIDQVILLNSPKGISRGLQRVGRSGHSHGATARGAFMPTVPADLVECLVTAQMMRRRQYDAVDVPRNCLDVLAQHLIGMTVQADGRGLDLAEAYALLRRTWPYAGLPRADFDAVVDYLAGRERGESEKGPRSKDTFTSVHSPLTSPPSPDGAEEDSFERNIRAITAQVEHIADIATIRKAMRDGGLADPDDRPKPRTYPADGLSLRDAARVGAKLWLDPSGLPGSSPVAPDGQNLARARLGGRLRLTRKGVAILYRQNVGTIASEGSVRVQFMGESAGAGGIGSVEESFASRLKPGDRFLLGGRCVKYVETHAMTAFVEPSEGQLPTVPRWMSGSMAMADGLCDQMRSIRKQVRDIAPAGAPAIARMLARQWRAPRGAAAVAAEFLHAQFRYADIPTDDSLLIERVPDETAGGSATAIVFHTMIGRAANDALARLAAYRLHQHVGGNATVVVDDYAFGVWLESSALARRADRTFMRKLLAPESFAEDLAAAVEKSELFKSQFRHTACRAHAIHQNRFGVKKIVGRLDAHARRLRETLHDYFPDHILLAETRRTILEDLLHAPAALAFLRRQQALPLRILDLPTPSPFAFGLFATSRRESMQLADTADFLLELYQQVQRRLSGESAVQPTALF